jgi:RNA polymerase sigma-70 factor (ECF subfamily)
MQDGDKEQRMTGTSVVRLEPGGDAGESQQQAEGAKSGGRSREQLDAEIAGAIDEGDAQKALLLCARYHGPALGRLAMAMLGSQHDAEDVTQETLLDAYHGFESWRREGSMRAWLMTIARRKCARLVEKRARRTAKLRLVHDAQPSEPGSGGTEKELLLKQRAVRARGELDKLRPSEREALLLRFGAGLSFREVGLAIGIDEAAARKRVSRAIANLRETLREEGKQP